MNNSVILAKAGIHRPRVCAAKQRVLLTQHIIGRWIPAFAGMTLTLILSACTSEEIGRAGYQSGKSWCSKTHDHCTVNND